MAATSQEKIKKFKTIQVVVVIAGLVFFIMMSLFPPWDAVVRPPVDNTTVFVAYSFIANPPHSPFGYDSYIIISYSRLVIQWALLITVAVTFYAYLNFKISKFQNKEQHG